MSDPTKPTETVEERALAEAPELYERLKQIDDELATLACSDGGCVVRRPKGMHTNGGCYCLPARPRDWSVALRLRLQRALLLRQEQVKLLLARPLPGAAPTETVEAMLARFEHWNGRVNSMFAGVYGELAKVEAALTQAVREWSAPRDGGSAAPTGGTGTAHEMPEVIVCRDCGTARAGRVLVCACGSGSWREPAPTVETGGGTGEPGCRGRSCADSTCADCRAVPDADWIAWKRTRAAAPSRPPARYFTCRCTRDHGATGCSGTGSVVSGGLCAWCAAEHRTTPAPGLTDETKGEP